MPHVPGAVCADCLAVVDGLVVADLKAGAAAQMLQTLDFETPTEHAVQVFLDLFGWQDDVVASSAMRLHADGKGRLGYRLLDAAAKATSRPFFLVEEAALRLLDGETGRAHDLLTATGPEDHPYWNLHNGTLAYSVGRQDAALEHWRLQVESQPDHILGWQTLGMYLLHELADMPSAVQHFQKACERFPGHPEFAQDLNAAQD